MGSTAVRALERLADLKFLKLAAWNGLEPIPVVVQEHRSEVSGRATELLQVLQGLGPEEKEVYDGLRDAFGRRRMLKQTVQDAVSRPSRGIQVRVNRYLEEIGKLITRGMKFLSPNQVREGEDVAQDCNAAAAILLRVELSLNMVSSAASGALTANRPGQTFLSICTRFKKMHPEVPLPVVALVLGGITLWGLAERDG